MTIQVSSSTVENQPIAKADRATYFAHLLDARTDFVCESLKPEFLHGLHDIREGATHEVRSLSLPSTRDEEWRFTDLSPLLEVQFQAPIASSTESITLDHLADFILPEAEESRLVFVDGRYSPELSSTDALSEGVLATNLLDIKALSQEPRLLTSYLDKQEGLERNFTTLNSSSFSDVAIVYIGKNVVEETPIHLLFVSTASDTPTITHPRCLVVADPNSTVTLIEDYVSIGEGIYFTNGVTEIWVDENARITHTRVQRDRPTAFHIGKTAVSQAKTSHYTCHAISSGAKLFRHNLEIFQVGEETETILDGLTLIGGDQVADTHSLISYTKPHGTSHQVYKAIVGDRAHAIFNGKVIVPQAAQLTNAAQLNRNLLLSPKGRVDTKPQLEIVADNVKCTHGATVSQLDADEVFYLQSRGIDADRAQHLLIYAFAAEIIQKLPLASLRETLSRSVEAIANSSPS